MSPQRTQLSQEFQAKIEALTGQTFQEVTLTNSGFCLVGTEEAVKAAAQVDLETDEPEYDESFNAWFVTVLL